MNATANPTTRRARTDSLYLDPWDHSSALLEADLPAPDQAEPDDVDVTVETDGPWTALAPPAPSAAPPVTFVDGVRRTHARLYHQGPDGIVVPGLCASIAAGSCTWEPDAGPARSHFGLVRARRVCLFGNGKMIKLPAADEVKFESISSPAHDLPGLSAALNQRMRELELGITRDADTGAGMLVADGRLGRLGDVEVIGYIKSHHRTYLQDPAQRRLAGELAAGQRTPLFAIGGAVEVYSWYLGLSADVDAPPWAGVARCEVSAALGRQRAAQLADQATTLLPRAVLPPWREARSPQNLGPIAALEWQLRRELGDAGLLRRAIELAVRAWEDGE
ncbi:MAG: hypothetical protein F4Y46_03820 [Chloroflexi bacterium]|nr:hypothetical protein [Chloroflexota bacterium]